MKRHWYVYPIAACLALSWLAGCARQPAGMPGGARLALKDCQLSAPGAAAQKEARCGRLEVFEDRQAGSGRVISLNVAVIPAVSRSPAPDPLFFLAGGPGEAASESFLSLISAFDRIRQKRDIVLVDQRGTGASHPLDCPAGEETAGEPDDPQAAQRMAAACLEKLDADPRLYTTAIAMDDLDEVRQALGYAQINLYGASYGTRAALAYLRQHPQHVRAVILDGAAPPNWTLGPQAAADGQRALEALFARCAAQPECQAAFPDLPQEFAGLLAQLEAQPAVVALEHPISGEPLTYTMSAAIFGSTVHTLSYTPETAALLPLMIHQGARGDLRRLAGAALNSSDSLAGLLSNGMRFAVICAEDVPDYPAAGQAPAGGYLGSFVPDTFREICQAWPRGDIPAGFKDAVASEAAVLILSGGADPVTPPANGELAARTLPNSRHVVLEGMGHVNIFRGCLPRLAADFIEQGSAAGLDISCAGAIQPLPLFTNPNGPPP